MGAYCYKQNPFMGLLIIYGSYVTSYVDTSISGIYSLKSVVVKEGIIWVYDKDISSLLKTTSNLFLKFYKLFFEFPV